MCLLFLSHYLGLLSLASLFLENIHVLDTLYGFSSDPDPGSQQWFLWAWPPRHDIDTPNRVGPSMDRFADYDCSLPATSMFISPVSFRGCLGSGVDDYSGLLRIPGHRLQSKSHR